MGQTSLYSQQVLPSENKVFCVLIRTGLSACVSVTLGPDFPWARCGTGGTQCTVLHLRGRCFNMCCQRETSIFLSMGRLLPKFQAESEVVALWPVLEAASQHGGAEPPTGALSWAWSKRRLCFFRNRKKKDRDRIFFFLFLFLFSPFNESLICNVLLQITEGILCTLQC